MKKASQALQRYLNMGLVQTIENFKGFVSDDFGSTVTAPYQQNLDYILIKLQGLAKLLIRVVQCAKKSASYFLGLIKAGSFYSKGVVMLSTIASVWNHCRELCKSICERYNMLKGFRLKVKQGVRWISEDYELPEDLHVWLGDDYTSMITNKTYDVKLMLRDADIESFRQSDDEVSNAFKRIKVEDSKVSFTLPIDPFEIKQEVIDDLELEDFTPISRNIKKEPEANSDLPHSLSILTSKDSVNHFIKNETHFRKVDPQKSLTINKMKKKMWKEFRDDIKNKSILMQDTSFIEYVKDYLEEYKI